MTSRRITGDSAQSAEVRDLAVDEAAAGGAAADGADATTEHAPVPAAKIPKYKQILTELRSAIEEGRLLPGERLPTEAELGKQYQASRITVAKAVNELMQEGLVSRRAGSGTHVLPNEKAQGHVFGLLIPDLGRTEIFEPICQGMMRSPLARRHSLLWGHSMGEAEQQDLEALQLCRQYIAKKVSGVFFAPIEFTQAKDAVNRQIAQEFEAANIPIVLIDRCYAAYPYRSPHDLVGIDNRAAGYMITQHVINAGARRPVFCFRARSASTVFGRIAGFEEALKANGISLDPEPVRMGDTNDTAFVARIIAELNPDAIVCANDLSAARLIATLSTLGILVPDQMRVVGIDDVKYASILPVPLTTQHQDCYAIGSLAMAAMLERLAQPSLPIRDILVQTHTIVRQSCGAHPPVKPQVRIERAQGLPVRKASTYVAAAPATVLSSPDTWSARR